MRIAAGIILLIIGVVYPMAMLFWLNARLRRKPQPTARQLGLWLTFTLVFPAEVVALGVGLLSARLWAVVSFRWALALVAAFLLVLLIVMLQQRRTEAIDTASAAAPVTPREESHG
jgi:hypothetical protein